VDQASGEYIKDDRFDFSSNNQLQVSDHFGDRNYYGGIVFSTDGSFRMNDSPSRGRVFMLRGAYQKGTQIQLYYEYYNNASETDSEYYDGYITIISQ
jgi:hypothetical protein